MTKRILFSRRRRLAAVVALLLLAVCRVSGQSYDSVCHHVMGERLDLDIRNFMELRDGGILANVQMFGYDRSEIGNMLFKMRYENGTLSIADSAFVEDHDLCYYLLERNPLGDDNVYAKIVRDFDSCRSFLQIDFFDDDLSFDPERRVVVPLEDTIVWWTGQFMIDPYGDIVLIYPKRGVSQYYYWLVRVGLDGTVKQKVCIPQAEMHTSIPHPLKVVRTAPLEFAYYGAIQAEDGGEFRCYKLDSLFQVTDLFVAARPLMENCGYWQPGGSDQMVLLDEGTLLLATRFDKVNLPGCFPKRSNGVVVAKFDWESRELLKSVEFESDPLHVTSNIIIGCARSFGMSRAGDGNIYMAYDTQDRLVWPEGWESVVKMTPDLEVIWQRYFLEPDVCSHIGRLMIPLENGGVAIAVVESEESCTVSFVVVNDEGVGVGESAASMRPYMFYPNPVADELYLQCSPDARIARVELYDMEGRLVVSEHGGTDRIGMEGLAPGIYAIRVTLGDGTSFTDKVVKQ